MRHRLASHLTRSVVFAALILFLSTIARGQSVSFVAGHDFQASQSDTSVSLVASGDFNNDGKVDLLTVTTGQTDNSISILLGNGDGTFQAPSTITTAPTTNLYVLAIAVGDFNGDGNLDFAVLNQPTNSVMVYLGNGNGTFQAPKTTTIANPPQLTGALVVADFNKDGKADVAVTATAAQSGTGSILVLIGKGDGTFQSPVTYGITPAARLLATGDVNGDKNIDLITDQVSVLLGKGDGTFQAAKNTPITNSSPCGAGAGSLGVGDFTGSGLDDVAIGQQILLSNGDGTFATPVCDRGLGSTTGYFAVGDFNNDGKADLATINQANATIYLSTGGGSVQQSQTFLRLGSAATPSQYVAADLNGDGNLDLVAPAAGNNVSVYLGTGSGTFLAPSTLDNGTNNGQGIGLLGMLPADLNGDGKPDLVAFGYSQEDGLGDVSVLINKGNGTFQTAALYPGADMNGTGAVGDLNKDGKSDLVAIGFNQIDVLLGNGDGTLQAPVTYTPTSQATAGVGIADFNGDSNQDLIVSVWAGTPAGSAGALDLLLGNGDGTFGFATNVATIPNQPVSGGLVVGDFNGDGKPDVAVAGVDSNGTDGDIWIYLNNGTGGFQAPIDIGVVGAPLSLIAADFNHDGKIDLALSTATNVQVFLGDGTGNFSLTSTLATGPGTTSSIVAADFNGDGIPDLAVSGNGISIFLGKGDGTFTASQKLDGGSSPIAAADFNGDGKVDLAWLDGFSIELLFNGQPAFSLSPSGPSSITVSPGDSAKFTLQVAPTNGFSGSISFACSGLPKGAACSFSPSSLTVSGGAAKSVTVTVSTTGSSSVPPSQPSSPAPGSHLYELTTLILVCASLLIVLSKRFTDRRLISAGTIALALLLILTCVSCGGGSSGNGGNNGNGGGSSSATPAGTYTLKITASSGSTTSTTNLTLIVN